jgi:predicted transposase/invertase (TIGR01784 family)
MSNKYDKIFKENIGEYFLSLSKKHLGIDIAESEELKDKLQTTLEREADFLRKVTTPQGTQMIVQLEFQTTDEHGMAERMQLYFAMLRQKYRLPVRQFVIYVGNRSPNMRTTLQADEIFTGFELLDLSQIGYEHWLQSNIPEEILLTVLGNFQDDDALVVLKQIISKLVKLIDHPITLKKYVRQLMILARLRSLTVETEQTLESMGLTYDIEKDAFYKRGVVKGKKEGKQEGIKEGIQEEKTYMVVGLLKSGKMTLQEIATLARISVAEVQKIADQVN